MKLLKRLIPMVLAVALLLFCTAGCDEQENNGSSQKQENVSDTVAAGNTEGKKEEGTEQEKTKEDTKQPTDALASTDEQSSSSEPTQGAENTSKGSNILVAYFSATGTTKKLAEYAAEVLDADLYEIVPEEPYTSADLNYNDKKSRTSIEMNDKSIKPAISGSVTNMAQYDVVFLGYPIWWGDAPHIMDTFMESYDFSGKTIVPFCTSGSSGIGSSAKNLHAYTDKSVKWLDGKRFPSNTTKEDIRKWVDTLGIQKSGNAKLKIQTGTAVMFAEFEQNSSAKGFTEKLSEGPVTVKMSDYGNFEKVGALGFSLPRNDEQITTKPGDIILYQGNQITIYYDTNSWNFTRMAKITDKTQKEIKEILGAGDITVTFSLSE